VLTQRPAKCREWLAQLPGHTALSQIVSVITGIDEWRRLDSMCDNPELFLDGIEPDDMQQGELGDCWFCQAVAAIAQQNPQRLEDLFLQKKYCQYGVYCLKLFVDNNWYFVVIDDYVRDARALRTALTLSC
jgi:hypothetical protein